jgi:hypothetical protein
MGCNSRYQQENGQQEAPQRQEIDHVIIYFSPNPKSSFLLLRNSFRIRTTLQFGTHHFSLSFGTLLSTLLPLQFEPAMKHLNSLSSHRVFVLLTLLLVIGLLATNTPSPLNVSAAESPTSPAQELVALNAELNRLKGLLPDQAHAMKDVGYHFANLWFAGSKTNWPLADFYWSETRSHLRWAVRLIPVRKDPQGNEIHLQEILDPIEKSSLETLHQAIGEKNSAKFTTAYKQMLESCYACHVASGKPFLRLQIPTQPEASIVRFEPEP